MAAEPLTSGRQVEEIDNVLTLLEAGIPLTLLLDLAMPIRSEDVYRTEPGAADWLLVPVSGRVAIPSPTSSPDSLALPA